MIHCSLTLSVALHFATFYFHYALESLFYNMLLIAQYLAWLRESKRFLQDIYLIELTF